MGTERREALTPDYAVRYNFQLQQGCRKPLPSV